MLPATYDFWDAHLHSTTSSLALGNLHLQWRDPIALLDCQRVTIKHYYYYYNNYFQYDISICLPVVIVEFLTIISYVTLTTINHEKNRWQKHFHSNIWRSESSESEFPQRHPKAPPGPKGHRKRYRWWNLPAQKNVITNIWPLYVCMYVYKLYYIILYYTIIYILY